MLRPRTTGEIEAISLALRRQSATDEQIAKALALLGPTSQPLSAAALAGRMNEPRQLAEGYPRAGQARRRAR